MSRGARTALEFIGPDAKGRGARHRWLLDSECQWVRARSARALWKINSDATEVLQTLLKELQCRPAGLLVADCLAAIGKNAQAAIPALRRIIDSDERGSSDIDLDEAFAVAAQFALDRIQASVADSGLISPAS